ncbi:RIP metalloprotease RseP [Longibacter salinarum]|uniref:RIP metalloprotease RseP n=1 Tax=Longibacter salinarum TaxID=1850348 RepID=A0A2A8CW28_9BACT|nr:site-2 protease family protein [Longibacter salinarum]PEN12797.1 RIP metalloprotease RseP [Longibacter salinarum]
METILGFVTSALWVILGIGLLVFIHELGHFLAAKYFGMRVEQFSIGFPPKIFSKTVGETEYVVGATPLGGYVRVSGMLDESLDTDAIHQEPEPHDYRAKPVWQRMIFITAGVIFNAILAVLIFAGISFSEGDVYIPMDGVEHVYVVPGGVADDMGMKTGDRVLSMNGQPVERFGTLMNLNSVVEKDTLRLTVQRDGKTVPLAISRDSIIRKVTRLNNSDRPELRGRAIGIGIDPPTVSQVSEGYPADSVGMAAGDRIVRVNQDTVRYFEELIYRVNTAPSDTMQIQWLRADSVEAVPANAKSVQRLGDGTVYEATLATQNREGQRVIGVAGPISGAYEVKREPYSLAGAVVAGANQTWDFTRTTVLSLKRVITGQDDPRDSLGGPVKIVEITSSAAAAGPSQFWRIVAILSITLAIMNILPIPALDGGHLIFLLYEIVTRREPSTRFRLMAQQIGMILLLAFITFLIFNDLMRL